MDLLNILLVWRIFTWFKPNEKNQEQNWQLNDWKRGKEKFIRCYIKTFSYIVSSMDREYKLVKP